MAGGAVGICFRCIRRRRHDAHVHQEAGALVQRQRLGGLRDGGAGRVPRQHRHRVGLPQPGDCLRARQAVVSHEAAVGMMAGVMVGMTKRW